MVDSITDVRPNILGEITPEIVALLDTTEKYSHHLDEELERDRVSLEADYGIEITRYDVADERSAETTSGKQYVDHMIAVSTGQALRLLGFDPSDDSSFPTAADIKKRKIAENKMTPEELEALYQEDGWTLHHVGGPIARCSESARVWIDELAHEALGLAPLYGTGEVLHVHAKDDDGDLIPLFDPRRKEITTLLVPKGDPARMYWQYHADPIEVRRRGSWAKEEMLAKFSSLPEGSDVRIAGIACGAAQPDLDTVLELSKNRPDMLINLDLIDYDHSALSMAVNEIGTRFGDQAVDVESDILPNGVENFATFRVGENVKLRLLLGDIRDSEMMNELAGSRGYDAAEALGLIDYTRLDPNHDFYTGRVLSTMHDMLAEGGECYGAVMSKYHNLVQILGVVGWSKINPMSFEELRTVIEDTVPGALQKGKAEIGILASKGYLLTTLKK